MKERGLLREEGGDTPPGQSGKVQLRGAIKLGAKETLVQQGDRHRRHRAGRRQEGETPTL